MLDADVHYAGHSRNRSASVVMSAGDYRARMKRRFCVWPLAYVGSSPGPQRAPGNQTIAEMTAESMTDAEFPIKLVPSFVGDGA